MKYLLILAMLVVGLWWWRNGRRPDGSDTGSKAPGSRPGPAIATTEIVACEVCHVHLPRSEALTGPGGVYCSDAHRQQATR
jgi:uncharacterized protein